LSKAYPATRQSSGRPTTLSPQGKCFYYRAIIKNVGNVRLENNSVTDSHHGNESVWNRDSRAVGESHEMVNFAIVLPDCCSTATTLHTTVGLHPIAKDLPIA
jgi:hypothetical protein